MAYISTSKIAGPSVKGGIARLFWGFSIAKERRALAKLTQAQLLDIGISSSVAKSEASRSFWDVPARF